MALQPRALVIPVAAMFLAACDGDRVAAAHRAKALGGAEAISNYLEKAAVPVATTGNGEWAGHLVADPAATAAFVESARSSSVLFRMVADGAPVSVPLHTRLAWAAVGLEAKVVIEGHAVPVTAMQIGGGGSIKPTKAAGIFVVTKELLLSTSSAAVPFFVREARKATGSAADEAFFAAIMDTATPSFPSTGNGPAELRQDFLTVYNAVLTTGAGRPYWAVAPDVANLLSAYPAEFPGMTPMGGDICGVPALVSSSVPAGSMRLVDASAIAGAIDEIRIDTARHAALEMSDTPASDGSTGASLVSLWQINAVAFLTMVTLGFEALRDNAVAELVGIETGTITP